jgi:hypothetical protein
MNEVLYDLETANVIEEIKNRKAKISHSIMHEK